MNINKTYVPSRIEDFHLYFLYWRLNQQKKKGNVTTNRVIKIHPDGK